MNLGRSGPGGCPADRMLPAHNLSALDPQQPGVVLSCQPANKPASMFWSCCRSNAPNLCRPFLSHRLPGSPDSVFSNKKHYVGLERPACVPSPGTWCLPSRPGPAPGPTEAHRAPASRWALTQLGKELTCAGITFTCTGETGRQTDMAFLLQGAGQF